MPLPVLETRRLLLRPYEINHLDPLHRLWTDPDVRRYLWDDVVISRERAGQAVQDAITSAAQSGIGFWSLFQRGKEKLEGFCGLRYVENGCEVELLYGLAPPLWKKGLATEAADAVLEYAFTRMHLERVYARSDIPNLASARVMQHLGMKFEPEARIGTLPVNCYSITREEFLAARSKKAAAQS